MPALNRAPIVLFVLLFSVAVMMFIQFNSPASTGQFTLLLACNNNGSCNPGETYANCPQDCCSAQCTGCTNPGCTETDGTCHSECNVLGTACSVFRTSCNGLAWGTTTCYDADSTVQCCSAVPVDCSATQFCSAGSCSSCSTVCDDACQSLACYGTDPDCDALGNASLACCGNGTCDGSETCTSCAADCSGVFACDTNADCDDSNSMTVDVCVNPGTCSAVCTNTACSVACDSNSACNDSNSLTVDVCNSPGTCSASCSNTPCAVACDSNSACNDSNSLTIDVCNNPDTCSAVCTNTACSVACDSNASCDDSNSLTLDVCSNPGTCSAVCSNTACSVACDSNSACNDSNSATIDVCVNLGACSSYCSNSVCSIECYSIADCDDSNSLTTDVCGNAGTCSAACSHSACSIECHSDDDCDDNVSSTVDTCNNAGTCSASCDNASTTIECDEDSDCDDSDPTTLDYCYRPGTAGAHCEHDFIDDDGSEPAIECSSDSECDDSDPATIDSCYRPGTAGSHCLHEPGGQDNGEPDGETPPPLPEADLSISFVTELPENVQRASFLDVLIEVVDSEGNAVSDASASFVDGNGNSTDLNSLDSGRYSGKVRIGADFPIGMQSFKVVVLREGKTREEAIDLNVLNAPLGLEVISPTASRHIVGSTVNLEVRTTYPDGTIVEDANVVAVVGEERVVFTSKGSGIYAAAYPVGQSTGLLELNIVASDALGNEGKAVVALEVLTQEQYALFIVGILFTVLVLLVLCLLVLLFYMRFRHLLVLEQQHAKYLVMRRKAKLMILTAGNEKKKQELVEKEKYLESLIKENESSLKFMRKRTFLTLGDIPMDLYFGTRALLFDIRNFPRLFRGKEKRAANVPEIKKIDSEISDLRELIKRLEHDFYKQLISPEQFKKGLFDYREKIHLLEIKRKKLV